MNKNDNYCNVGTINMHVKNIQKDVSLEDILVMLKSMLHIFAC
jgi:hypothetical protein